MNKAITLILLTALTLACSSCDLGQSASDKPVSHSFLCADYGGNMIYIVSADQEIIWQHPANRPQDVWQLPNGNMLVTESQDGRLFEVTLDGRVVWEYLNPRTMDDEKPIVVRFARGYRVPYDYFAGSFGQYLSALPERE